MARAPEERVRNLRAALSYHVGNLLRERLRKDDVAAAGLKAASPKEWIVAREREMNAQAAAYRAGLRAGLSEQSRPETLAAWQAASIRSSGST